MARIITHLTKKEAFSLYLGSYILYEDEIFVLKGTNGDVAFVESLGGQRKRVPIKKSMLYLKPITQAKDDLLIKIAKSRWENIEDEDTLIRMGKDMVSKHSSMLGYKAVDLLRKHHFHIGLPREYYITKIEKK